MKQHVKKREINSRFSKVVAVGFCDLQHLLQFESPIAYTTRPEGWGADIYAFGNVAICTGYAPFGNVKLPYDTLRKYDDAAREIRGDWSIPYDEQYAKITDLLMKFITEEIQ